MRKHKPVMPNNLKHLKFIFSETIGSQAQADLINYSIAPGRKDLRNGCYKNHSGLTHVASLPSKLAKTVGKALVEILATAVMPEEEY